MVRWLLIAALFAGAAASAATVTLYDDTAGNLPGNQPWLVFGANGAGFSQTAIASGVELSSNNAVSAGYSSHLPFLNIPKNPAYPALNRSTGFSLSFELQLLAEAHDNNDRAGFSVILLSSDLQGIEIGFWAGEIWTQSGADFQHAEGTAYDTTADEVTYRLQILGSGYRLLANGIAIHSGALRNYSSFGIPYSLPGFLFLGDDTSSASATVRLGLTELSTDEVPEASTAGLVALGICLLVRRFFPGA